LGYTVCVDISHAFLDLMGLRTSSSVQSLIV
jgi:hypothetical protein